MPLYEYDCQQCDHGFEALVRSGQTPECPSCRGTDLRRRLSVFAATHEGERSGAAADSGSLWDLR